MPGKVVHFEIPIDENDRALGFYEQAFGWTMHQFGPVEYWPTQAGDGEGIGGALTKRNEYNPALMFYIEVEDIDAAFAKIEQAGGKRASERMPIPGVGYSAFFDDTEGNRVGIFQPDASVPMPEGGLGSA
jgi:uncharacterized protein